MRDEKKYRALRQQAKELYLSNAHSQKEIAALLSVAPKTVSEWSSRYKWKAELEKRFSVKGRADSLYDFIQYARSNAAHDFPIIERCYKKFLLTN